MHKDLEYILNFDENLLFNTDLDDTYSDKEYYRNRIREAKERFKRVKEERERISATSRALDVCRIHHTDTPHQALAYYIETALGNAEYLWFLEHATNQLRKVENDNL